MSVMQDYRFTETVANALCPEEKHYLQHSKRHLFNILMMVCVILASDSNHSCFIFGEKLKQ
jgi:hypothetical protein